MKIKDNSRREIVQFNSLADGAVFKDEDGLVCLKLPKTVYEAGDDDSCDCYNAYNLTNDEFTWYSSCDRVEKIQAELVLSNFNRIIT